MAQEGVWTAAFDHEHSGSNATPYLFPGASLARTTWEYQPGGPFGWGSWIDVNQPAVAGKFNAIHMALLPKGPHRGKVLVWNRYPVFVDVGTACGPASGSRYWACQAWSIVDPAANAPAPRGYYLLWVIDNGGVPSTALWVRIQ